ncbi:AAA family ATPase [Hyphococcus sp.]|uniref:AAA family ATPase n=1 Tax=Hyphococcus sp. TaxID=2038636 RepID=UPI003CCBF3E0
MSDIVTKPRGFVLGKFMPPHRGHLFLCDTARRMVDKLTVLVCSTPDEPVPGKARFLWMAEAVPYARVLHCDRDLPQEPADHPDFWRIWREVIEAFHPEPIDRVFAGEPYGFRLAEELGAEPVIIDPDREAFSISGTAIRKSPAAHWDDIAAPARERFQKRLCILGPESTGKSRLAAHLADRFRTRMMPEYGRAYDVYYKQSRFAKGTHWTGADLMMLAETHAAMRAALAPLAGPLFIEDTDAIQTAVWAEHLLDEPLPALERFAAQDTADHYLLLSPDTPWSDDGVRYAGAPETRAWFFDAAKARLDRLGLSYDVISGADWEKRSAEAEKAAEALLAAPAAAGRRG